MSPTIMDINKINAGRVKVAKVVPSVQNYIIFIIIYNILILSPCKISNQSCCAHTDVNMGETFSFGSPQGLLRTLSRD